MKITNNTNLLDSNYSQTSLSTQSKENFTKMPLAIKCYTPIWETDSELRMQILKRIAKMLQTNTNWSHLEFDCETLSVKLTNPQLGPVLVKVYKRKFEDGENRNILSLNDLVTSSLKIRSKLIDNNIKAENTSVNTFNPNSNCEETSNNQSAYQQQYYSKFSSLGYQNTQPGVPRPLPRLIIRKRSNKPAEQFQQTNKTGAFLKHVDSLFQKIKSEQTIKYSALTNFEHPIGAIKTSDTYDTISRSVLNLRVFSIDATQLGKCNQESTSLLFRDEIKYFSSCQPECADNSIKYPFYNPFGDSDLILGMYKEQGSRVLVDTVCDMVNDMITACCKLEEKLNDEKINSLVQNANTAFKQEMSSQKLPTHFVKPNIIRAKQTTSSFNNTPGKVSVAVTPVKKALEASFPSKQNLVYQIIKSTDMTLRLNNILKGSNNNASSSNFNSSSIMSNIITGPSNMVYINKPVSNNVPLKGIQCFPPRLSTVKLENTGSVESDANSEGETSLISGIKAILPTTKSSLNYKTLVKIVAPEKNSPEGLFV